MRTKAGMTFTVLFGCMLTAGCVLAQTPDITAFHGNGNLTWTNTNSTLFYQVQWAASLGSADVWNSSYTTLTDIQSTNATVTIPVPMFYRVASVSNRVFMSAMLPRSGQTNSYAADDDGALRKGVVCPNPRFSIQTDTNVVRDNLTGLMWARNANMFGAVTWGAALNNCASLNSGGYSDWRLPNVKELQSLMDFGLSFPSLCNTSGTGQWTANDPFTGVLSEYYWSSTTYVFMTDIAWCVYLGNGYMGGATKTTPYYVWPVRGGD